MIRSFLMMTFCLLAKFQVFAQWNHKSDNQFFKKEHLEANNNRDISNFNWDPEDLIDELEKFEAKSWVLQIGIGLNSDLNLKASVQELEGLEVESFIPSLNLTLEKNIWNNLGVGITLGGQAWKISVLNYQYRYITGGIRLAYHVNIAEKLDPYFGVGGTYRNLSLRNKDSSISNHKITGTWLIGARYYLKEKIATFIEIGNDQPSWFKAGFAFYFPK